MRAIWNGHITFGLITIPVAVHSAVEASERVSFRLLHRKDHAPIVYKKFCSKEDVEVSNDDIVKGYELEDDTYAAVEKEDIEKAEQEAAGGTEDMEVLQFVELGAVNPLSYDHPYYLSPRKGGEKAYGVLRDALLETKRIGIVRFVLRKKPTLGALLPGPEAIALESLRPWEELRDPARVGAPPTTKKSAEVKMAKMLVDQMSGEGWNPSEHPDEYRKALRKMLSSKKRFVVAPAREGRERAAENVVDLMDALKKSLGQTPGQRGARRASGGGRRKTGAA